MVESSHYLRSVVWQGYGEEPQLSEERNSSELSLS